MSPSTFEELLSFVVPIIEKENTVMRYLIGPSERLALTLRYLVTGDAQRTIAASYRISPTSITMVLSETCNALWVSLLNLKFIDPQVQRPNGERLQLNSKASETSHMH